MIQPLMNTSHNDPAISHYPAMNTSHNDLAISEH